MANELGLLSPEDYAQQQAITRQQRMAEMLMSQNQQPQGQMISGRYVAPSFFQNILPLVNTYVGKSMLEEGDVKASKLAEAIRTRGAEDLQNMLQEYKGTSDYKPAVKPLLAKDDQGYAMPNVENQVGVAPNPMAAILRGSNSNNPIAKQFAGTLLTQMTKAPEYKTAKAGESILEIGADGKTRVIHSTPKEANWVSSTQYINGKEVHGWVNTNAANPATTFIKGSVKPDFTPKELLELQDQGINVSNPVSSSTNLSSMTPKDIIATTESGKAGYDAIFGYSNTGGDPAITKKYGKSLSQLSIGQVLTESTPRMANNTGAVGRYQFLPSTLKGLLPLAGLKETDQFSPENQEKLYTAFKQQNSQALKNAGVQPNDVNLHLAHAVGAGNVPILLKPENQNKIAADVLNLSGADRKTNPQLNVPVNQYLQKMSGYYQSGQGGQLAETPKPPANLSPKQQREWTANYEKEKVNQEFNPKSLTEVQSKATSYGMRMIESNNILSDLAKQGVIKPSSARWLADIPVIGGTTGAIANYLSTDEQGQLLQAKRNFITAVLRKESGAVISDDEFKIEDEKYFPQKGDGPKNIEQKAKARELAIRTMKIEAGPGSKELDAYSKEVSNGKNNKPVTIKSDADYAALESGTEFIDPKGNVRRKP